jgi:hypothetical protein
MSFNKFNKAILRNIGDVMGPHGKLFSGELPIQPTI